MRGLDAEREARVVDEDVDGGELRGQRGSHGFDGCTVAHVELDRQQRAAELGGERVEALLAAGGGDDAVAALDESTGDGGAETCRRTGDEHDHCCCS
ncbi:Uncharacterised protein [Burkholderia pseudomallei]|nr:Uncharacterised protein [Burkholderia pseudomallei]CAJ9777716.1 Uncharacterised protein [Burkholderia pseudomallei]